MVKANVLVLIFMLISCNVFITEAKLLIHSKTKINHVAKGSKNLHSTTPLQKINQGSTTILGKDASVDFLGAAEVAGVAGSSSYSSSVINLSKTILGAGALSLSYGIASFTDSKEGIIPGITLLFVMGAISAYSFYSIGRVCDYYSVSSFSSAWERSVGASSKKFLEFIVIFKTFFTCLAYSIIIGDSFSQMFKSFKLPSFLWERNNVITTVAATVLFPLSILKQLDALKYTSFLGILGIVYCAVFLVIRYFDQSYTPSGKFFELIAERFRPSFDQTNLPVINSNIFLLISMISTAYVCHYNAPKFYSDLKEKNLKNFSSITQTAFSFAFIMYVIMMSVGFLIFGGNSTGFILNNFANQDFLATIARIAIGTGIVCTYPLTFTAFRDTILDFFAVNVEQRNRWHVWITLGLLSAITGTSLFVNNVGKVVSISGALIGSLIIYIIPMLMNLRLLSSIQQLVPDAKDGWKLSLEKNLNYGLIVMGVIVAVIGVKQNVH